MNIIYYTHNRLDKRIMEMCQAQLRLSGLPIVTVCLEPMDFGDEIIIMADFKPSIQTMYRQIIAGLEWSRAKTIFMAEHDVLYHPSHFEIEGGDDTYFYNVNVWRWAWQKDWFITYDHIASLSGLCAPREMLLAHYHRRIELITKYRLPDGRNPGWARQWGHEPGKPKRRGGILDEKVEEWVSDYPNIDIRHRRCMTPQKMTLDSFRRLPTGWREATIDQIPGWTKEQLWS